MKGQIVKILSNLYFVNCEDKIYECHSRGNFRNKNITPVVGDYCVIDEKNNYILEILPRKNYLIRPLVANIDQGLIVTSLKTPDFSTNLLDKLILVMELNHIKPIICITKEDIADENIKQEARLKQNNSSTENNKVKEEKSQTPKTQIKQKDILPANDVQKQKTNSEPYIFTPFKKVYVGKVKQQPKPKQKTIPHNGRKDFNKRNKHR